MVRFFLYPELVCGNALPNPSVKPGFIAAQTAATLAELLARISRHDRTAFAPLYQATSLKLYGVVFRILRRKHLAEDVLQEVYVKIWERAGDFDISRGSPITWMAAIARNRALDEVRRKPEVISAEDVAGFENIAASGSLALDQMERSEEYKQLVGCLDGIEEEKRHMLLLAYQHGLSREFLAQKFNRPVATIKTWLRRSLELLKQCLEQ